MAGARFRSSNFIDGGARPGRGEHRRVLVTKGSPASQKPMQYKVSVQSRILLSAHPSKTLVQDRRGVLRAVLSHEVFNFTGLIDFSGHERAARCRQCACRLARAGQCGWLKADSGFKSGAIVRPEAGAAGGAGGLRVGASHGALLRGGDNHGCLHCGAPPAPACPTAGGACLFFLTSRPSNPWLSTFFR